MISRIEILADAVKDGPRSFDRLRRAKGLALTDKEFRALIDGHRDRFQLVRFLKRDDEGQPIRPGRPGVKLREALA